MEEDVSFNDHKVDGSLKGTSYANEYVGDHSSLLSLQPWIFRKEICPDNENKMTVNGDLSDNYSHGLNNSTNAWQAELSPRSVSLCYGRGRGQSSLRSRRTHRYSVKPVASVGNCLIPRLYNDNFEFDECVLNSAPSSAAPIVRPFVITDENRIISESRFDSLSISYKSEFPKEDVGIISWEMETVVGVPPLPQFRSAKQKSRDEGQRKSDASDSPTTCQVSHSQDLPSSLLLFSLGISIGVISTIISNRRETERLKKMLKHNENLVEDLMEELDMKDSLIVKELDNEPSMSPKLEDSSASVEYSMNLCQTQIPMESSELSRIEAELEAELEKLELDMNASSLEGKMTAVCELDLDLVADGVHGDLRADMLNGGDRGGPKTDGISTAGTHDVNYAVSPRELSLRLHEVIQYRLEERVKELETALHQSQTQLEIVKAEQILSQRAFSNSERDSFQPLHVNLARDARDVYHEAYKEFMLMADDELCIDERELLVKTRFSRRFSGEFTNSSDSDSDDDSDDEEGKILIQHVVERTRQGSPVVMHAHRMPFAMDR